MPISPTKQSLKKDGSDNFDLNSNEDDYDTIYQSYITKGHAATHGIVSPVNKNDIIELPMDITDMKDRLKIDLSFLNNRKDKQYYYR